MKNQIIFALVALTLITISCKKDNNSKAALIKQKTDLLTLKPWKPISTLENGIEILPTCGLDNTFTFFSTGIVTKNAGADDCDGIESSFDMTWKFGNNDETKIILDGYDVNTLVILDENTLKLKSGNFIDTYKH